MIVKKPFFGIFSPSNTSNFISVSLLLEYLNIILIGYFFSTTNLSLLNTGCILCPLKKYINKNTKSVMPIKFR